ncbi:stromal interaction molecule homolog isoform X2 [Acyrthosiphon pisum]|uniref:SAM domain-containing protein n=1 Tax=Acyrthosiphon pisum TaxID=7029 RepID=A0A8R2FBI9_ACYPI|nr:stromal interaction molecule homolog isoform X2 [Acyrthosiphon pisum]|eukprot:XP_008186734.1 PREDICTED: stromal interaction molecule homolog isoform X2 [Acyrthosiphon pisum]
MCSKPSLLLLLWSGAMLMLVLPVFCESNFNPAKVRVTEPTDSGGVNDSCNDDIACLTMATQDRLGLDAIRSLHRQLDDDADGAIDLSESDDFLREELKYEKGAEKRQKAFHQNDDMYISVKDLWDAWVKSEVHNWTVEQTCDWLSTSVELPQYVPNFIQHRVTGAHLPRLAVTNNMQILTNVLGIKDPIHKQKIALKAMDVVLFGPPKDSVTHLKDLVLITLLLGALIGFWYVYNQNKSSTLHLKRMMRDMEGLQKAETAYEDLQKELEKAKQVQEFVITEKANLEKQLQEQQIKDENSSVLKSSYSNLEISQLKTEIESLRGELARAEGELDDRCWTPPHGLQQWLQLTHEVENKSYIKKKLSAEKQLQQAREACEKLRKKRSSLVGAFVSTHGKSIDDVDRSIVEARTSLNEVTQELAERVHRWKQIETLCGFNIINNNGRMSSQDDLEDDSSQYSVCVGPGTSYQDLGACENSGQWRDNGQDSSGSDQLECVDEEQQTRSLDTKPCFILGEDICDLKQPQQSVQTSDSTPKSHNIDSNQLTSEQVVDPGMFRHSNSDSSLDPKYRKISKVSSRSDIVLVSPTPSEVSAKRIKRHKLFPIFLSAKSKAAKSHQNSENTNVNNDKAIKSSKQKS